MKHFNDFIFKKNIVINIISTACCLLVKREPSGHVTQIFGQSEGSSQGSSRFTGSQVRSSGFTITRVAPHFAR